MNKHIALVRLGVGKKYKGSKYSRYQLNFLKCAILIIMSLILAQFHLLYTLSQNNLKICIKSDPVWDGVDVMGYV